MQRHNQDQNIWAHVKGYGHKVVLHELVFMHCWSQQQTACSTECILWRCDLCFFFFMLHYLTGVEEYLPLQQQQIYTVLLVSDRHSTFLKRLTKFIHQLTPGVSQEFSRNLLISVTGAAFGKDPAVYLKSPMTARPMQVLSDRLKAGQIVLGVWPMRTDKIQAEHTLKTQLIQLKVFLELALQQPSSAPHCFPWELGHTRLSALQTPEYEGLGHGPA